MTAGSPASSSPPRSNNVETVLKLLSPLLAIAAFVWGIYTYRDTSGQQLNRQRAEAERTAETRRIEATRPYLDKQLALYTEATVGMSWQRRGAPTRGSVEV